MKIITEKLRIKVDATVRSVFNHIACGQPDLGVGINAPPQSRSMSDAMQEELQSREDKLVKATNKGIKANSFEVYRQNLD